MKLSILIPTIESRKDQFWQLFTHINAQRKNGVEVIFESDNKEISIGAKRQSLIEKAKGKYIVFIDDDDWVSDTYVEDILTAIASNPDAVGFEIECSGTPGKTASASNKWKDWQEKTGGYDYVRTPYQKTPIRRDIALKIGYKDMRFGEDYDYSKRLKQSGLIKTETYIPKVLYFYRYAYENPKTKYGEQR